MPRKNNRSKKNNRPKGNNQQNKSNHWAMDKFWLPLIVTIIGGVVVFLITNRITHTTDENTPNPPNQSELVSELRPSDNSYVSTPESRDKKIIMSKPKIGRAHV